MPIRYSGIAQTLPSYVFSDVFSQWLTSSGGTRSEIGVTAPPQTCVSTGPVAHCAPMSGPVLAAAAAWNVAMKVSVACGTTLIVTFGCAASYAVTAAASASFAPGRVVVAPEPHRQVDLLVARRPRRWRPRPSSRPPSWTTSCRRTSRRTRPARGLPSRRGLRPTSPASRALEARMVPPPRLARSFTVDENGSASRGPRMIMAPPPGECKRRERRSERRRADHVDADHDLVAERRHAVRTGRVEA